MLARRCEDRSSRAGWGPGCHSLPSGAAAFYLSSKDDTVASFVVGTLLRFGLNNWTRRGPKDARNHPLPIRLPSFPPRSGYRCDSARKRRN